MKNDKRTSIFERRSREYDRNMNIIKRNTRTYQDGNLKPSGRALTTQVITERNELTFENEKEQKEIPPLKAVVRKIHVQQKVHQFIAKLKRNNFSNKMKVVMEEDDESLKRHVDRVYEINGTGSGEKHFTEGIVVNNTINMWISLLSFLTVIYMQVISSFECFLYEFRALEMNTQWLISSQYICLLFAAIKIVRNFTAVKTRHGYRIVRLQKIFLLYLYSLQFVMDLLFFLALLLMLSRPYSVAPAFAMYVISLIVILITPRIDDIITSYIHVSPTTRQYLALVRLLLANLFFNHIMGTTYMAIADTSPYKNWMIAYGIQNNSWASKYNYSFYFAVSVTSTAVLGDVRPANNRQAVLTSLMMIYGCLVYSFNISQMTVIFSNLQEARIELQKELQVLDRLVQVSQLRNKLHRDIANYLVRSNQSKFQSEIKERKKLILKLPENLREEYLEQNSFSFFKKMPFFSILRLQTKKILAETFTLEISSPGQNLTHKREGMQRIVILKMGTIGLAYNKRNATLNGMVLDKLVVENDEVESPILLNAFLFNRRKRINYSIVCETFCTVGTLEFDSLMSSLRECETDYEFWLQFQDSDQALDEEWTTKTCEECGENHTMFNCPKLTYMPLRSIIYMKYSSGKSKRGLQLFDHQLEYEQSRKEYLQGVRSRKNKEAVVSPLKFWKRIFVPLQKVLEIDTEKNYYFFNERSMFTKKKHKIKKELINLMHDEHQFDDFDTPTDFTSYFKVCNPKNLVKIDLGKRKKDIPSISSI